jgi:DNA-binding HxlR family transcriptional regulator
MTGDSRSFKRNIEPLITDGLVERTVPDKPNSKLQKYRLTDKGKALI